MIISYRLRIVSSSNSTGLFLRRMGLTDDVRSKMSDGRLSEVGLCISISCIILRKRAMASEGVLQPIAVAMRWKMPERYSGPRESRHFSMWPIMYCQISGRQTATAWP